MALTGIRDLSMINTPPADRRPILTYVGEQDERRSPRRSAGSCCARARSSSSTTGSPTSTRWPAASRRLVPEARVAVAHGQMDEGSLEQVVLDFWERHYDVLVCTTIIESGIDMPTVNTLVVDRADLLGLGQLHQIRGRVGRAGQRAYAYLFHPADRVLTEQAYERLRTIGEHTELGSGFKIAMRDLEIRGAGNLLGRDQSGHIAAVGYDLYVQMVAEAVGRGQGRAPARAGHGLARRARRRPPAGRPTSPPRTPGSRPTGAWPGPAHEEVDDVAAEWVDRYGPLPPAGRGPAGAGPAAGRVPAHRRDRGDGVGQPRARRRRPDRSHLGAASWPASAQARLQRLAQRRRLPGGGWTS